MQTHVNLPSHAQHVTWHPASIIFQAATLDDNTFLDTDILHVLALTLILTPASTILETEPKTARIPAHVTLCGRVWIKGGGVALAVWDQAVVPPRSLVVCENHVAPAFHFLLGGC